MEVRVDELEALDKQLEMLGSLYETSLLPQLYSCRDRLESESAMTRTRYNRACNEIRNRYQQELRQYYTDFQPITYQMGVCVVKPPEMQPFPELNISGIVSVLTMIDDNINSLLYYTNVIYMLRDSLKILISNANQTDTDVAVIFDKTNVADINTQAVIAGVTGYISPLDTQAFKYKDKWGRVHTNYGTEAIASSMVENNVSSSCIDTWAKKVGWSDEQVSELHTAYDFAVARTARRTDELMSEFEDSAYILGATAIRYGVMREADSIRKSGSNSYSEDITGSAFVHDCYRNVTEDVPNSFELWGHYGYKVDELEDLETGDVLVFSDIVGMYVANDRVILNDTAMGGISVRALPDLEVWHGGLVSCRRVVVEEGEV